MASFRQSFTGTSMCETCGLQPKYPGFDHCGKTCAVEAEKKKRASRRISMSSAPRSAARSTSVPYNSPSPQTMCLNCRINPIFPGHYYCSKVCAGNAKGRSHSTTQTGGPSAPPNSNSGVGYNFASYNSSTVPNAAPTASNLCEHCNMYVKSREMDEDGVVTTHSYCGIACYKASLEQNGFHSSSGHASSDDQGALNLRVERLNTPIGRKILNMVQERWKSDEIPGLQVKGIYRIDLPGQVYRRFDLALQMNDLFSVSTTYYGALATCSITDDADPSPCASEACELCDALRSSFGNLLYGASCRDGSYGPGLYTYLNPAMAHDAADVDDDPQGQNYALIQCRVVTRVDSVPISNSYSGFLDDSGVVFCAQPTAVIPTHLLTYVLGGVPNSRQAEASVNLNSTAKGQNASGVTSSPGGPGRKKSVATDHTGPKSPNGKGQALANLPLQKPQRQSSVRGSPMGSPLVKQVDQDPATSAIPGSDPATTSVRALVKFNSRGPGTPTGTRSPPPYVSSPGGRSGQTSNAGPSGAGSQKAARQLPNPSTGSIGDPLGEDSDDDPGSYPAATRQYVKRPKDLDSRLDEDEDEYGYASHNGNSSPRKDQGRRGEDEDSDDDLPDHPPGRRV